MERMMMMLVIVVVVFHDHAARSYGGRGQSQTSHGVGAGGRAGGRATANGTGRGVGKELDRSRRHGAHDLANVSLSRK